MQITIAQPELEIAVRDYVSKQGITREVGQITFTATRSGDAGVVTTIDIDSETNALKAVHVPEEPDNVTDLTVGVISDAEDQDATAEAAGTEEEEVSDGDEESVSLFG